MGTTDAITDEQTFAFDEGFYNGLANSQSIQTAIELGRNRLGMINSCIYNNNNVSLHLKTK